ncbi:Hypothetical predicted protein [Mytilus galloprovincialis]|uniref:Uncharacterized protein n=1 Tax=Mytilus galloprovincialis TaxID=29158 RepID=A0A8B6GRL6_MYTGA|nr:Hypothetical predicted protein [Mytilus galloprovincialis]
MASAYESPEEEKETPQNDTDETMVKVPYEESRGGNKEKKTPIRTNNRSPIGNAVRETEGVNVASMVNDIEVNTLTEQQY